jgi:hypothetical protein
MATVLLYLTDTEEGGETAFPAGSTWSDPASPQRFGPFSECAQGSVAVRPRKGATSFVRAFRSRRPLLNSFTTRPSYYLVQTGLAPSPRLRVLPTIEYLQNQIMQSRINVHPLRRVRAQLLSHLSWC